MAASDAATRIAPFVEQLMDNSYAQENLRDGIESLRSAYERSQKRRAKGLRDEPLRRQVQAAALSIAEGAKAVKSGRTKPKKRRGKRLTILLGLGAMAAAAGLAANEDLRNSLLGGSRSEGAQG